MKELLLKNAGNRFLLDGDEIVLSFCTYSIKTRNYGAVLIGRPLFGGLKLRYKR